MTVPGHKGRGPAAPNGPASTPPAKARISIGPEELETFLAIAELGSFSKAAERLSLAQPSISNRVQRLERAVRTRLFERTTRAVILTPAGERLRTRVEPIVRSLHDVIDEFCDEADARSHSVVVAATPMLAALLLPPIIDRFCKANPAMRVQLLDQVTAQVASDIRSGHVDLAILGQSMPGEGIAFEKVTSDPFMVVGPRGHPALAGDAASVDDLARHPFLLLAGYKRNIVPLSAEIEAHGLSLRVAHTVTNVSTLLGLVSANMGLTLLPSIILRVGGLIDDKRFAIASLRDIALSRDYGIASLAGHDWSPGAKAFAAAMRSELLTQFPARTSVPHASA